MRSLRQEGDVIAFRLRRTYLYTAVGALAGFAGGFTLATILASSGAKSVPRNPVRRQELSAKPAPVAAIEVGTEGRPSRGATDAPVTIVEFTDYECPFCRRHFQYTLPALLAVYGDKIRYVVRNYPIASLHPRAPKAAEAAECAHDQDTFWQYHDLLLRQGTMLDVNTLKRYAAGLQMDTAVFNRCLDTGAKAAVVRQDVLDASGYGVRGTPAFFVNGHLLAGAKPFEVFASYIDAALEGRSP